MNKQILNIIGLLIILAGLSVTATYAQSVERVHIPFDFSVQNKTIPAGNYVINRNDSQGMVWIISNNDTGRAMLLPLGVIESKRTASSGKLTFHRYGEMYYLASLETSANKVAFPKSRSERSLIRELNAANRDKKGGKAVTSEILTIELTIE
jgi:hypothetical protein